MNETPDIEHERFCARCGAERLGTFCWRCGAPALSAAESQPPPAGVSPQPYATFVAPRPPMLEGALAAIAAYRHNPTVLRALAVAAAAVVTVASIALPPISLLLGLAALVVTALALRADAAASAHATEPDRA